MLQRLDCIWDGNNREEVSSDIFCIKIESWKRILYPLVFSWKREVIRGICLSSFKYYIIVIITLEPFNHFAVTLLKAHSRKIAPPLQFSFIPGQGNPNVLQFRAVVKNTTCHQRYSSSFLSFFFFSPLVTYAFSTILRRMTRCLRGGLFSVLPA